MGSYPNLRVKGHANAGATVMNIFGMGFTHD